jgi:dephospho-CoA kinase
MRNHVKIIGLTGNIATGKSVVRRMLANSGSLGLDADWIAHRMLYPSGAAFTPVVETFGKDLLIENGELSRQRLGEIVFNDPLKLSQLENLTHPHVKNSILKRIETTSCPVVAIEAIKLLESGLSEICDTIWVSHASYDTQVNRLMTARGMSQETAEIRISSQPPQWEKLNQAEIVINTEGSFRSTWRQIQSALNDTIKSNKPTEAKHLNRLDPNHYYPINHLLPHRVEDFWRIHSRRDIPAFYEALGMKMALPILEGDRIRRLLLWENWNFTARLLQVLSPDTGWHRTADLLAAFEEDALSQQCEILLLPNEIASQMQDNVQAFGFEQHKPASLSYPAWRQAAGRLTSTEHDLVWAKVLNEPFEEERDNTP